MLGPFGRIRLKESQLVLPTYQIQLFLYRPSIHIYDSLNLIVDTLPRKVVQGSYLFTVDLAFLLLRVLGFAFPSRGNLPEPPMSLPQGPGARRA
jgi:hypothetical protein